MQKSKILNSKKRSATPANPDPMGVPVAASPAVVDLTTDARPNDYDLSPNNAAQWSEQQKVIEAAEAAFSLRRLAEKEVKEGLKQVVRQKAAKAPPSEDGQFKNWTGTVFVHKFDGSHRNSMDELTERLKGLAGKSGFASVGAEEKTTPEEEGGAGLRHHHLVLCLERRKRFKQFIELWKDGLQHIHWEPIHAKSTPQNAYDYSCKEGPAIWECGNLPDSKGKVTQDRWKETRAFAEAGQFDLVDDQHYVTHFKNIHAIGDRAATKRIKASMDTLNNYWIMGHTGAGKSLFAREANGRTVESCYSKCVTSFKWWDHYENEPNIIVEDIDEKFAEPQQLKIWCDHYAFHAETKGGMKKIRPQTFIFTSNVHPHLVYGSLDSSHVQAIDRRLQVLLFFKKNYKFPAGSPYLIWPKGVIPSQDIVAQVLAEQNATSALSPDRSSIESWSAVAPKLEMFYPCTGPDFQPSDSEVEQSDNEGPDTSSSDDSDEEPEPTQPLDVVEASQPMPPAEEEEEEMKFVTPTLKRSVSIHPVTPIPKGKKRG